MSSTLKSIHPVRPFPSLLIPVVFSSSIDSPFAFTFEPAPTFFYFSNVFRRIKVELSSAILIIFKNKVESKPLPCKPRPQEWRKLYLSLSVVWMRTFLLRIYTRIYGLKIRNKSYTSGMKKRSWRRGQRLRHKLILKLFFQKLGKYLSVICIIFCSVILSSPRPRNNAECRREDDECCIGSRINFV